jgi:hypothetical protein
MNGGRDEHVDPPVAQENVVGRLLQLTVPREYAANNCLTQLLCASHARCLRARLHRLGVHVADDRPGWTFQAANGVDQLKRGYCVGRVGQDRNAGEALETTLV